MNGPPRIRSLTGGGTGKVHLNLDVVPGRAYAVESSPDLSHWTTIITRTATNYLFDVTDPAASLLSGFYRAIQTAP